MLTGSMISLMSAYRSKQTFRSHLTFALNFLLPYLLRHFSPHHSVEIRLLPVPDLQKKLRRAEARWHSIWCVMDCISSSCCVSRPDRDPPRGGRYCRFAYSVCVVHFRKVVNRQKIGSPRNGHPVIYLRGYMDAYYKPENDNVLGKSAGWQ